ncbi:pupal cuticle protein G1A-like [Episyrphus balteatus]|uniref:pupal cuticle protein G1A-like n=1 Tax=Episyrphus balteatus TaxID=286459 RepID=UPI0024856CA7|nr:pupal cuticle protein G1A-like [Episyrphus balteatus]
MFKLVVLSVLLAVAAARPGLIGSPVVYSSPIVQEHGVAHVGNVVKSVPTAVSHQSSTVVHNSANVVEPIVAPVVKTYAAAPVHAPLVQTYAAAAPVVSSYSAVAPAHISYAAAPAHISYAAAPAHISYAAAAPVAYASAW